MGCDASLEPFVKADRPLWETSLRAVQSCAQRAGAAEEEEVRAAFEHRPRCLQKRVSGATSGFAPVLPQQHR